MKRLLLSFACAALLLLCLPLYAFAIVFDGNVNAEWSTYPLKELSPNRECGISIATVRVAVQPSQKRVMFGFTASADGVEPTSPIGAAFLLGGQVIAHWQHGLPDPIARFVAPNSGYGNFDGKAYFLPNSLDGSYTFEIALGYENEAALAALKDLSVVLYGPDPQSPPSWAIPYPIVTATPVTTTKAPTTERTTTTRATTTAKPTTAPPVYTTAPPAKTSAQLTTARASAAPQAAAPAATQKAQPGTSRTEVFYYTVVYTDTPDVPIPPDAPDLAAIDLENLWTSAFPPSEASQPQSVPTLAMPAPQPSRAASPSAALLFSAGGVLVLLAAVLILFWLRAQKKPSET